MYKLRL